MLFYWIFKFTRIVRAGLTCIRIVLQLDVGVSLPSPAMLKRKIIIKNKKRHGHKCEYRLLERGQ